MPLGLVAGVSIAIHLRWEAGGFWLNLSTELVGILITIGYVDWILRSHETARWERVGFRVASRLKVTLNVVVSSLRVGLGYGPEVMSPEATSTSDTDLIHEEIIRVSEHILSPGTLRSVFALDEDGWQSLARQVQSSHHTVSTFLNTFQGRLDPQQVCLLLDMQQSLANSLTFYSTFPDIMGVPVDQLPLTRTPSEELQRFGCEATVKEIRNTLAYAKALSDTIR